MTYRSIVVHVNNSRHMADRVRLAARIAADNEAHLTGVATTGIPASFYMSGLTGEGATALTTYIDFMKASANTALSAFEAAADSVGALSLERRIVEEEAGVGLCVQARYADLLILGQSDPDEALGGERSDIPEYVVLNGGRPVLLVPYSGRFDGVVRRALIAWDGSPEAARAVSGAIPLLRKADLTQVAVFNPDYGPAAHGDEPGADIALYLARHDVRVEVVRQQTAGGIDIGNALLSHASDLGADLLVMGGYGHSRFREVLLGGVTRTVMESMTIPVLMAH